MVFRLHKKNDYSTINNTVFKDYSLSYKAKGLLAQMLSLPDDWNWSARGLTTLASDGESSVKGALLELENAGYLKRTQRTDEKNRFAGYIYDVFEMPMTENPLVENPPTEKPTTENPPQYNNKEIKEESINKENINPTPLSPKGKQTTDIDLSFVREDLLPIMKEWLEYKKERGQKYKQIGVKKCYSQILEYSNGDPEVTQRIIDFSISNNYQGLFPLKQQSNGNNTGNRQTNIQYGNPLYEQMFAEMERNGYAGNY